MTLEVAHRHEPDVRLMVCMMDSRAGRLAADVVSVLALAGIVSLAITLVEVQRRSGQSISPLHTD